MAKWQLSRWLLLAVVTAAVTFPLSAVGVPSAALFAALGVGIVLALASVAPSRVPRRAGLLAQGVLGVYIGTMVHGDAIGAIGAHWPIVLGVVLATLFISVGAGALMGLHRDVSPRTGAGRGPAGIRVGRHRQGTRPRRPGRRRADPRWVWSPRRCRSW